MRYSIVVALVLVGCADPEPPGQIFVSNDTAYVAVTGTAKELGGELDYRLDQPGAEERKWLDEQGYYFSHEQLNDDPIPEVYGDAGVKIDPEQVFMVVGRRIYVK